MEVQADRLAVGQVVAQAEAEAVARMGPQSERLDGISLETEGGGGLELGIRASGRAPSLLLSDPLDVRREREHAPVWVMVQITVVGDLDCEGSDLIAPLRRA